MTLPTSGDSVTNQARLTTEIILSDSPAAEVLTSSALGQRERLAPLLAADPGLANAKGPDGKTPLHLAAQWGQKETLELLLAHGADATARDQHGSTPLHIMAGHSTRTEIAELLLAHGLTSTRRTKTATRRSCSPPA